MVMHGTQFEFHFEIKPTEKQAVPRKVSLYCRVITSNNRNKTGGSGYSILLQITDDQVFVFTEPSKMTFVLVKANKRTEPCRTCTSVSEGMLVFLQMQKDI